MLIACLVAEHETLILAFADPMWPSIKVKVIETSMGIK